VLGLWFVFMNPKGYVRMYTPMWGYSYIQWLLVGVLTSVLIYRYWPMSGEFLAKKHPMVKGLVMFGLSLAFAVIMVNLVFQLIIGHMGISYFSEEILEKLKINPYNSREYSSMAILFVGATMAMIIPIWSLHWYNWPEKKIEGHTGKHTSLIMLFFFVTVFYTLVLHPHMGILFYPWQEFAAAFPWWESMVNTLSGRFNLGWMVSWTAAIWIIQVLYEGWPINLVQKQPWRGLAGIFGTFTFAMILFVGFVFLQEVVWGPAVRGSAREMSVDWRYLHAGETAMFALFIALVHGIYFNNWPKKYSREVNILVRTVIVIIRTLWFYILDYKVSPMLLGTQKAYSHPNQFPLSAVSLLIALMLAHTWYFDKWPGEKLIGVKA